MMDLSRFPRRIYTPFPTPIQFLPQLSKTLGGPKIWIKRDDMLGLAPGGNKTRKLEFLVADALTKDADCLITCGAPQSNHCRITLTAARKEGLGCHFVIEERVPGTYSETASGNNFVFRLMSVDSITVVPAGTNMAEAMESLAARLRSSGRRPYVIPGGGSNAIGGLGYVACAQEMQQQFFELGLSIDYVIVGSGSSGTHGGLIAGFVGNNIDIPIIGVGVSRDPQDQKPLVEREACAVAALFNNSFSIPRSRIVSVGGYWQPKYSIPNALMIEAVKLFATTEGILLDPVYTGKIAAGMIGMIREKRFKPSDNILFIHTGGATALHAYEAVLS
jgi:D-cysteine desulfhydrase